MRFVETDEFTKELKKLSKKYPTLLEDFDFLKEVISCTPTGNKSKHWNLIKADESQKKYIFKLRLKCRSTKGAHFRVIYFYDGQSVEVVFIEIYFKGKKENENRKRIDDFWRIKTKG